MNDLNAQRSRELSAPSPAAAFPLPYLDVNGDGHVDPQDVLIVVNWFNTTATGEGELPGQQVERGADDLRQAGSLFVAPAQNLPRIGPHPVAHSTGPKPGVVEDTDVWLPIWPLETSRDDVVRATFGIADDVD